MLSGSKSIGGWEAAQLSNGPMDRSHYPVTPHWPSAHPIALTSDARSLISSASNSSDAPAELTSMSLRSSELDLALSISWRTCQGIYGEGGSWEDEKADQGVLL